MNLFRTFYLLYTLLDGLNLLEEEPDMLELDNDLVYRDQLWSDLMRDTDRDGKLILVRGYATYSTQVDSWVDIYDVDSW